MSARVSPSDTERIGDGIVFMVKIGLVEEFRIRRQCLWGVGSFCWRKMNRDAVFSVYAVFLEDGFVQFLRLHAGFHRRDARPGFPGPRGAGTEKGSHDAASPWRPAG